MDKTTKQIKNDMTKQQDYLGPCHLLLVYVYILLISLIFVMHIDVTKKYMTTLDTTESILYSSLIRDSPFLEEISLPYLRQLINWAVITILFLIKIPSKDICIYNSMQRSSNLNTAIAALKGQFVGHCHHSIVFSKGPQTFFGNLLG